MLSMDTQHISINSTRKTVKLHIKLAKTDLLSSLFLQNLEVSLTSNVNINCKANQFLFYIKNTQISSLVSTTIQINVCNKFDFMILDSVLTNVMFSVTTGQYSNTVIKDSKFSSTLQHIAGLYFKFPKRSGKHVILVSRTVFLVILH